MKWLKGHFLLPGSKGCLRRKSKTVRNLGIGSPVFCIFSSPGLFKENGKTEVKGKGGWECTGS